MKIPLALDTERITSRLNSLAETTGWATYVGEHWIGGDVPDAATIYRWANGERMPKTAEKYLKFCSVLDVDPFSLLRATGDVHSVARTLIGAFQNDSLHSTLAFVKQFSGRVVTWPPLEIAKYFACQKWITIDFQHIPDGNVGYGNLKLTGDPALERDHPQLIHFAFSHESRFGGRWLHYGFVTLEDKTVKLQHIDGSTDCYVRGSRSEPANVQTNFLQTPANFRLASLHPFQMERVPGIAPEEGDFVRFP
ncbi:MAG: hypothetical protein FHP92_09040 [Denitromonas halophila]|nr:MAG: hypothetical protein FHP92_09040 [Denitromonas halophila]